MKALQPPSFSEAVRVWVRVALLSFGGPAGQIAVMHRIVVEEKGWVDDHRFTHALNFCMVLPGPEAHQLATYLGWLLHGIRGGLVAGILFVLPGVVAILALSWVYAIGADTGFVEAIFFGLKCAVLAIVFQALVRIGSKAIRDGFALGLALAAFVGIFFFNLPFPLIILAAAVAGLLVNRWRRTGAHLPSDSPLATRTASPAFSRPTLLAGAVCAVAWLAPVLALWLFLGGESTYTQIAAFFSKMAVVTFGGAYAVLAYVAQQAVENYGWLAPGEMLDGLGLAETTPGPLIMVVQFVGFLGAWRDPGTLSPLLAGTLGGMIATWVTFVPSFLWIFLLGPWMESLRENPRVHAALSAITAAVVGVIANLAIWFSLNVIFTETRRIERDGLDFDAPVLHSLDILALGLTLAALLAAFRFRRGVFTLIASGAGVGLLLHLSGLR